MKKSIGLIILIVLTIVIMLAVLLIEFTVLLNPDAVVSRVDIIDGTLWIHYSDGTIMNSGIVLGANSQGRPPQSNRPSQSAPEADPETQAPEPETEPVLPPEIEPETEPETETRIREYTVSFVLKGYSGQIPSQTVREGNRAQKPTVPVDPKVGTFDGVWYTSSSYSAASRYNFSDTVTKNITLYGYVEPNPAAPVNMFKAEDLTSFSNMSPDLTTNDITLINDYIHIVPSGPDPNGYPIRSAEGARYVAIRYRTDAVGADIQAYIGSSGEGPVDDSSMLCQPVVADGEWHLAIFDTQALIDAGIYDGHYISYFRFDPLEAGYKLDEDGLPYKPDGMNYARYDLPAGCYIDVAYIGFFNSSEYAENYDYELHKAPMWNEVDTVVTHMSFDELDEYAGETRIQGVFYPGQSASWDGIVHLQDFSVDTLRYWGWIALKGEVGQFGYQINGGKPVYNDAWTHATEDGVIYAAMSLGADTGSRMQIMISLAGLDGENTIRTLYKSDKGVEVCLSEFTVILPVKPKDITDTFASNVQSNAEGTDLRYSDLADFFTVNYGAGDPHKVVGGMYQFGGIHEIFADVNGKYSFKMNQISASGCSWMFVRGYQAVNSDELIEKKDYSIGIYMINNYYETDGTNWMGNMSTSTGGAGIYAHIQDGTLYVVVKYYDETNITRVGNKSYSIPCDGTELTMADDGENVYILVNGKTMAVIELEGSTVYADINDVRPKNGFVTKATVKLADGSTDTILNTLVAETCECQIGLAVRAGQFKFDTLEVGAYSAIEIPEFETPEIETPDEPAYHENYSIPQARWMISGYCSEIIPATGHANSPMVAAAGVESAALLHQGSIYVGDMDLSKYDKVVIYWGTDNSQVTIDHYNANANTRVMLLNDNMNGVMSPDERTIIASSIYELRGWHVTAVEIDLSRVNYSGPVYVAFDSLPGTFMVVGSVEFIGSEISEGSESEGNEVPNVLTDIPTLLEIGMALPNKGEATDEKYLTKGVISQIGNAQYGNMYIRDEYGNELYVYGLYSSDGSIRYDKMENQPQVGDSITVWGVIGNYNGVQMKYAWLMEWSPAEPTPDGTQNNPYIITSLPSQIDVEGEHDLYYSITAYSSCTLTITYDEGNYVSGLADFEKDSEKYTFYIARGETIVINIWGNKTGSYVISYADERRAVDYTRLDYAINSALALDSSLYDGDSWEALENALATAQQIRTAVAVGITQSQITYAAIDLEEAIDNLQRTA